MKQPSQTGLHISETMKIQTASDPYGREKLLFLRAACFFVILWGTLLMMAEGLGLELRPGGILPVLFLVCAMKTLWYAIGKYTAWELPAAGGLWVLVVLFGHRSLYSSYLVVENACRGQLNNYYGLELPLREVPMDGARGEFFVGILFCLIILFLGKLIIVHGRISLFAMIELLFFALEMVCGCHFFGYGLYLTMGGFFVLWAMGISRLGRMVGPIVKTGCWVLVILIVLGLISSQILGPYLYRHSESLHDWLNETVVQLENKFSVLIHEDDSRMGNHTPTEDGGLNNDPLDHDGGTDLVVTVSEMPETSVYLKGFVGGTYENTYWDRVNEKDFRSTFPDFGDAYGIQNILYRYVGAHSPVSESTLTVSRARSIGDYAYNPYGFAVPRQVDTQADGSCFLTEDMATYEGYVNWRGFVSNGPAVEAESELEAVYRDYVPEEYLKVPVYGLDRMKEYCDALNLGTVQEVIDFVVADVRSHGTYSQDLEPVPAGDDFIEYFYFEQQKGYCIHYASTATMMLRLMGVPARYVTGYMIPAHSFIPSENGYVAEVSDTQAHAWVEVYRKGKGWIPLEVTPGFDPSINESGQESADVTPTPPPQETEPDPPIEPTEEPVQETLPEELSGNEETSVTGVPEIPSETPQPNEREEEDLSDRDGGEPQKESGAFGRIFLMIVVTIFLLAAAGVGIWKYRKERDRRKRDRLFRQKNCNQGIVAISWELFSMYAESGYTKETSGTDLACAVELEKRVPVFETGELQALVALAQEAAFGSKLLAETDRQACLVLFEKAETWLLQQRKESGKSVLKK